MCMIKSFEIDGYKNISKSNIKLSNFTAIIAVNNFGKSNILDGLNFGIEFIKAPNEHKSKMMKFINGIPYNKLLANKEYSLKLNIILDLNNEQYDIEYSFAFKWDNDDNTGTKITSEILKMKSDSKPKYTTYINRENNLAKYKTSIQDRCSKKIIIEENELVINKIKAYDDLFYIELIKRINDIKLNIDKNFNASLAFKPKIFYIESDTMLNDKDIAKSIFGLKKNYPDDYERLIDVFKTLFPNIKDIKVVKKSFENKKIEDDNDVPFKINNDVYRIMVVDKNLNQIIDFDILSDGTKRIFLQLANILFANIQNYSLIAIEEPENSIHPKLFKNYIDIINEFSQNINVVITSHSPYLLQYLNPTNIYVGVSSDCGIAMFQKIKKSCEGKIINNSNKYNMNVGEYLFDLLNGDEKELMSYMDFKNE